MNRRKMLKLGVSFGALGAAGLAGRYTLLPPSRSRLLASVDELAQRFFEGLEAPQREQACVPYDHPLRQYHNRGVWGGGLRIWRNFGWDQRRLLVDLMYAGISEAGRERMPEQWFVRWPGIHLLKVLVCGEPSTPPWQIILTGPHLNLRLGGRSREGVAFGGPQVYGDQRGNGRVGLPGNRYRYQFEIAARLFETLKSGERERATYRSEPVQTQIELQGSAGSFPGVALADLAPDAKRIARTLVDAILENYPAPDVEYARACMDANGGIDPLFLSTYEEGEEGPSGPNQIFRLEGPAAVFHFRGAPHVHAFVNVSMDGEAPLSVGELLGENPAPLEGAGVKALFEDALCEAVGTEVAYYEVESVVGRLRRGPIRTGDVYNLESWQDLVTVVEVEGASLRPALIEALEGRGIAPDPARDHAVATTGYVADELAAKRLGRVVSRRSGKPLREAAIAYLREHGFERG